MNDLKFAFRQLLKHPGFTTVAVLTLALGIGINLMLFAFFNVLLFRPRPVRAPYELWAIRPANGNGQPLDYGVNLCRPYYDEIRRNNRVFDGIIGYATVTPKFRTQDGAEMVTASLVSGEYFNFLGVVPAQGRAFSAEDDKPGASRVAVLSHRFWQQFLNGDQKVIGRAISLNDQAVEVIGVMPAGFLDLGRAQPDLWLPTSMEKALDEHTRYNLVGRLKDSELAVAASDSLAPVVREVTQTLSSFSDPQWIRYGYAPGFQGVALRPAGRGAFGGEIDPRSLSDAGVFAGLATSLVLAIAMSNLAILILARAFQRRKELATRLALGATRWMLVRQLILEGLLLSAMGTAVALFVTNWTGQIAVWLPTTIMPMAVSPNLGADIRVLGAAVVFALAVGIGFSLVPALHATRFDPFAALKDAEGGVGLRERRFSLKTILMVAQNAGSLVLLSGAVLCVRTIGKQLAVNVGFDTTRLALARLDLERVGFTTNTAPGAVNELVRRLSLVPGAEAVCWTGWSPFSGDGGSMSMSSIEGYTPPPGLGVLFGYAYIGPNSFHALGVGVLDGRELTEADFQSTRRLALVNQSFVEQYWPGERAIGRRVGDWEIIGVVPDVRMDSLEIAPGPAVYFAAHTSKSLHPTLIVRTRSDPRGMLASIRHELSGLHPRLAESSVFTMRTSIRDSLRVQNSVLYLLGGLSALAVLLAGVGAYGLMSQLVTQRTREIGIRLAVGATPRNAAGLIIRHATFLAGLGMGVGLPLALVGSWVMRSALFGLSPLDPTTFAAAGILLATAMLLACWLPARRAARVDPVEALRYE